MPEADRNIVSNGYAILSEFLRVHQGFLWAIGASSVLVFAGSLVVIPVLVIHIPADYFIRDKKISDSMPKGHSGIRLFGLILKNITGIIFVLAGIAMLVLPGQGIITLLIGIMLLNFPGKPALEKRILEQKSVLRTMNWIRSKARKPALMPPREKAA